MTKTKSSQPIEDERVDASSFWNGNSEKARAMAHWLGHGSADTYKKWRAIGESNLRRFRKLTHKRKFCGKMLEWGCGGGSNVVIFGKHFSPVIGVDVSEDSLLEASRRARGHHVEFYPYSSVHAARQIRDVDLFLCVDVFQHMITSDDILEIMKIARETVKDTAYGLFHWRIYGSPVSRSKFDRAYLDNIARYCMLDELQWQDILTESGWEEKERLTERGDNVYCFAVPK